MARMRKMQRVVFRNHEVEIGRKSAFFLGGAGKFWGNYGSHYVQTVPRPGLHGVPAQIALVYVLVSC
jgi:hypothetical protein